MGRSTLPAALPASPPSLGPDLQGGLCRPRGPRQIAALGSPSLPRIILTWHHSSSSEKCHQGAKQIQPEAAPATESPTPPDGLCSDRLSELITRPQRGGFAREPSHVLGLSVLFPRCVLRPALGRPEPLMEAPEILSLPAPFFAFGF